MRVLQKVVIGIVVLFLVLGVVGFFLPSAAHVERTIDIDAPVANVYSVVSDMRQFNKWSPWFKLDPDAKYTFKGEAGTVGSAFHWESEMREVGAGSQTIKEVVPNELVRVALDFGSEGLADSYYKLAPTDSGTRLVWGFDTDVGGNPYMHYFAVLMDSMVGPYYEEGLNDLKRYVEGSVQRQ